MNKRFKRNIISLAIAATAFAISFSAIAQLNPNPPAVVNDVFSGTSLPLFGTDGLSPYGYVTRQDISASMIGYGLMLPKTASETFMVNTTGTSSAPAISASSPADFMIGTMLVPIKQNNIDNYLAINNTAFQAPQINSSTSYSGASIANFQDTSNSNQYNVSGTFAAPYNVASLFHYTPAPSSDKNTANPLAYQKNPADVYIALASGALTPQPVPNKMTDSLMMQIRRLAALQSAGVYALQDLQKHNMPLSGANAQLYQTLSNGVYPTADQQGKPLTERDLEKLMATRRLDPKSGWYSHLQQATPIELQREQLYLQAEMLYEMYQLHHTEEVNEALLASALLSQNYNNRSFLNQQAQVSQYTHNSG